MYDLFKTCDLLENHEYDLLISYDLFDVSYDLLARYLYDLLILGDLLAGFSYDLLVITYDLLGEIRMIFLVLGDLLASDPAPIPLLWDRYFAFAGLLRALYGGLTRDPAVSKIGHLYMGVKKKRILFFCPSLGRPYFFCGICGIASMIFEYQPCSARILGDR